ncbi:hypothetical protein DYB32_003028 [Aphanomyces invadans]|uniref:ubiquitinyl hydrolase 1 n=1 Tax=Aphanomyces invadans TaxID=157072 RepID=A0A3R6ZT40_9STRA|nr:hypothetical protein DYB32_003028 [Aphanomyces invadans]
MQSFTPLIPDSKPADPLDEIDDDLAPPQLHPLAIQAATKRVPQPVPQNSILLFLKRYDPSVPNMDDRLTYVGNIVVAQYEISWSHSSCDATVSKLTELIQHFVDARDQPLDIYEQLQPEAINLLDSSTATLLECELQHGDILIFQNETNAMSIPIEDPANLTKGPTDRQYPTAPLYFEYLLNRIDVVFCRVTVGPSTGITCANTAAITLTCLLTQSYDDVVAQLAVHVSDAIDALHLRLYPHSTSLKGPKDSPFQHRLCTGDQMALRGMIDNFTTNHHAYSLYYEVLPSLSIVEVERKVKWSVHLSPYEPSFHGVLEMDLLLDPTDTVAVALAMLQTQLAAATSLSASSQSPPPPPTRSVTLHLIETRDRSTVLKLISPKTLVANVLLIPSAPLFVDATPTDDERGPSLGVVGVMHYHSNAATWIHTHSTPCIVELFQADTVRHVRQRLQQRYDHRAS